MSLDYNKCLIEQGISGSIIEISDEIFKATSYRMREFLIEEKMYNPLDCMTKDERQFCKIHTKNITICND